MKKRSQKDIEPSEFNIFLITGQDQYSVDNKIHEIISFYLSDELKDFNFSHFNEENFIAEQIGSALYSLPVMSEKRVVLISGIDKASKEILDTLESFISKNVSSTILILSGVKPDKRKSFFKGLTKVKRAVSIEYKEKNERELLHWMKNHISSRGYDITRNALMMLSLGVSNNLSNAASEIDKIIEYSSETNISEEVIENVLGISKEYNIFKLQNAVAEKNLKGSLYICDNILKNKNNKTEPIAVNLFLSKLFTSAFEIAYFAVSAGTGIETAAQRTGYTNSWKDRDTISCAKNYSAAELLRSHRYFLECDIKLKSSYQDSRTAVLLLLEKIIHRSSDKECEYLDFFNNITK